MIKRYFPFLPAALIAATLLTTLLLFGFGRGRSSYVLFFPLDSQTGKDAEIRLVYRGGDEDTRMERFLRELILGPVKLELDPFIPSGTKIRSMVHSGSRLYIDFNRYFISESSRIPLSYQEKIEYLEKNISFNYPGIRELVITVEGQIPGSDFFALSEESES